MPSEARIFPIDDFGAKPEVLATDAIQKAIDAAARVSGTVYLPPGRWISGTLQLRSNVTLHLCAEAMLQASPDFKDYRAYRPSPVNRHQHHFIIGDSIQNVSFVGGGAIDGNFDVFQKLCGESPNYWCERSGDGPDTLIELRHCSRVLFDNVRITRSPCWTVHLLCCDDAILRGLRIDNHIMGGGTDGIVTNGSRNVFITECKISTGEDGISVKASEASRQAEHITIANCMVRASNVGIHIGPESREGISYVTVSNCILYNCNRMLAIASYQGGEMRDIAVANITGDTFVNNIHPMPIQIDVKMHPTQKYEEALGTLQNLQISNFSARTTGRIIMTAQNGARLENIVLRDIRLHYEDLQDPDYMTSSDGRDQDDQYNNFNLEARRQRAALIAENIKELVVDGFYVTWPGERCPVLPMARKWGRYRQDRAPYAAVWARHIAGGRIDASLVAGHAKGQKIFSEDTSARIVE